MFNEKRIQKELVLAFKTAPFADIPLIVNRVEEEKALGNYQADIQISATVSGSDYIFVIKVKDTEQRAIVREAAKQAKLFVGKIKSNIPVIPFIGGRFFSQADRQIAKEEGVGLVDLAGNFYFNYKPVYIEKVVGKNPFTRRITSKDLFSPISSRISRVLLIDNQKAWKIGELAETAEVSIGLTSRIISKMIQDEIVIKNDEKQYLLKAPSYLLNEWRENYNPKKSKVYKFSRVKPLEDIQMILSNLSDKSKSEYALSHFTGALFVAPYIINLSKVQMYIESEEDIEKWMDILELRKVEEGANVELYVPFDKGVFYGTRNIPFGNFQGEDHPTVRVVSNIQLYLDLYKNPSRGREQADHLRETKIGF